MAIEFFKVLIDLRCDGSVFMLTEQRYHIGMLSNRIGQITVPGRHRAKTKSVNIQTAAKGIDLRANLSMRRPLARRSQNQDGTDQYQYA